MLTKVHPCISQMILSLLKGNLLSNSIRLISHKLLWNGIGIYSVSGQDGR